MSSSVLTWALVTPLDPLHGDGYQFWSGVGGGSPILIGLFVFWRHHNCHVRGCWRLRWRSTAAGDVVCRRHHPEHPKTHEQILEDHHRA